MAIQQIILHSIANELTGGFNHSIAEITKKHNLINPIKCCLLGHVGMLGLHINLNLTFHKAIDE